MQTNTEHLRTACSSGANLLLLRRNISKTSIHIETCPNAPPCDFSENVEIQGLACREMLLIGGSHGVLRLF